MSALAARFFTVVQGAAFYRALHSEAVQLLVPGEQRRWLDAGCGRGLVARLARARGYDVTGIDRDADMVRQARRLAGADDSLRFEQGTLEALRHDHALFDVVSAASLLHVVPDRRAALEDLLQVLAPGGTLLVVETTSRMAAENWAEAHRRAAGAGAWVLPLWQLARRRSTAVDLSSLCPDGWTVETHSLLGGWVDASLVRRAEAPSRRVR